MTRTDLRPRNATRVELNYRSREARLQLEHTERLLVVRLLPKQSLLRRVLRVFALRHYAGGHIEAGAAETTLTRLRAHQESDDPAVTKVTAGNLCAVAITSASTIISRPNVSRVLGTRSIQSPATRTKHGPSAGAICCRKWMPRV